MKKLILALLTAVLFLTGCSTDDNPTENVSETPPMTETDPAETAPKAEEKMPDPDSPVKFNLESIPKDAVYFTVCRHKRSGDFFIKSDALLEEYSAEILENCFYYIPRGDAPEILETAEGGGAFVVDDNGLRLVVIDGGEYDLPFEEYKNRDEYDDIFFRITCDEAGGGISGVIEYASTSELAYNKYFYSTFAEKSQFRREKRIIWNRPPKTV